MSLPSRSLVLSLLFLGFVAIVPAQGQNEGLSDLDRATETKLTAQTLVDWGQVIQLCESALEKGLDEGNSEFAQQLLASTCIDRGTEIAKGIFRSGRPHPNWPSYRNLALKDLERGIEFDPRQPQALFLIAQLNLLPGGDADRLREALDEAIRFSDDEPALLVKCYVMRTGLTEDDDEKLADLNRAMEVVPDDLTVLRVRGSLYSDMQRNEEALEDLEAALEVDPDHAPTVLVLGIILTNLERYDDALEALNHAAELAPEAAAPLVQETRVLGIQEKFEQAMETIQAAHKLEPANPMVLLLRASLYQETEQPEKALADIDQVLELVPGLPTAMRFRAMLLAGTGKLELAIEELESLQELNPEGIETSLQLALFYSAEERHEEAIEKYSAILQQWPENPIALQGRGDALLGLGKHAEAVADYNKALEAASDDSGILNNLAWVLCTSPDDDVRDGQRAIELATKACEVTDYKAAHILSTLGAAYAETGDFETAIEWSEKAVELGSEMHAEALKAELETYKKGQPFREKLLPGSDVEDLEEPEQSEETEQSE